MWSLDRPLPIALLSPSKNCNCSAQLRLFRYGREVVTAHGSNAHMALFFTDQVLLVACFRP